jgi:rubredoxin
MRCPECLSSAVAIHEYDFGVCPQTGYHDAGERFRCRECGSQGDAADLADRAADVKAGRTLPQGQRPCQA